MSALTVSVPDIDMETNEQDSAKMDTSEIDITKKDANAVIVQEFKDNIRLIEKGVLTKESRFIARALRSIQNLRKKMNATVLTTLINTYYTYSADEKGILLDFFKIVENGITAPISKANEKMVVDSVGTHPTKMRAVKTASPLIPEIDAYIHLFVVLHLIDEKNFKRAQECVDILIMKVTLFYRRSLDLLAAKCLYYYTTCYEFNNELDEVRDELHRKLRTASLKNDFEGQAVAINCLLRSYLHDQMYDQAEKLITKSTFPDTASSNEWARFLYYLGRIKAIRLEYSEALIHLSQALRKAPQFAAIGFTQAVNKMIVIVQLLLGDIPDRNLFRQATLRVALNPYYKLVQAVRLGDLKLFGQVLDKYEDKFTSDHTYMMIIRLRQNVIKTAIRAITASYIKITSTEVAKKLGLESAKDAEFIIAKAIRDGVIEAKFNPQTGVIGTKETSDIYCTTEPQAMFHERTAFCLELRNQSIKAMRYPPKSYEKDLESVEERREREQQDLELAKEMAEEEDDEDDGFP